MKRCVKCLTPKPLNQFYKRTDRKGSRRSRCKTCTPSHSPGNWKKFYQANRERLLSNARRSRNRIQEEVLQYLLSHPCVDCGETDLVVLQFDHVRGKKQFCIGNMMLAHGWDKVQKEIEKCDVRCSNCHDRKTAKERNNFRWKRTLELGLRK